MLQVQNSLLSISAFVLLQHPDVNTIDWENAGIPDLQTSRSSSGVQVPNIPSPLHPEEMEQLQSAINPRGPSQCFGRDIYLNMVQYVHRLLAN